MNLKPVVHAILEGYELPIDGDHGVSHWARVYENGMRLSEETRADRDVVALFAVLHDSQRVSEISDPEHGPRAARFATLLNGWAFHLKEEPFQLLQKACEGHTHERTHPNITIQTCWDADRLDLGRVGIFPETSKLCTNAAKNPATIKWADGRACFRVIPDFVLEDWGIDLSAKHHP